jgi:hypothetical protein
MGHRWQSSERITADPHSPRRRAIGHHAWVASKSEVERDEPTGEAAWHRFTTQRTAREPYSRKLARYRTPVVGLLCIVGLVALIATAFFLLDGLPPSMRWREPRLEALCVGVATASFLLAGILWLWPTPDRAP